MYESARQTGGSRNPFQEVELGCAGYSLNRQQGQIDAISKQAKTQQQPNKAQPTRDSKGIGAAHLPPEETGSYASPKDDKKDNLRVPSFWISVITLLVLVIYTVVSCLQWSTAVQALQIDQWPYITVEGVTIANPGQSVINSALENGLHIVATNINFNNTGKSPARFVIMYGRQTLIRIPGGTFPSDLRVQIDGFFAKARQEVATRIDEGKTAAPGIPFFSPLSKTVSAVR